MNTAAPQPKFDPLQILDVLAKQASRNTARKNVELEKAFKRGSGILGASASAARALELEQGIQQTRTSFDALLAAVREEIMAGHYEVGDLDRGRIRGNLAAAYRAAGGVL